MSGNVEITPKDILEKRIYPAIKSCVDNRQKIVAGIFAVYAFIKSSLNTGIKDASTFCFIAWIFTFFVLHNSINYYFNAKEQFKLEKKGGNERVWTYMRAEGLFTIFMLLIIWLGYFKVLL